MYILPSLSLSLTLSLSHFLSSKFVPRGSVRVFNAVVGSTLESIAFLTPQKQVVVVVMNTGDQPITFKLMDSIGNTSQAVKVIALAHSIPDLPLCLELYSL